MAGVGEDNVLIGTGLPSEDEIRQLEPETPEPPEPAEDNHEDLPDTGEEDERRTTEDDELDAASNDAEREKIRARRRQERADKRQRAKDRFASLDRKLSDQIAQNKMLENRLLAIEKSNHGSTIAQLNVAVEQADQAAEQLLVAKINATNAKDGAAMLEAEKRIEAIKAHRQTLIDAKAQVEKQIPQQASRPQAGATLVEEATKFRKENPWFADANSPKYNEESRLVSAIDNQLLSEGWDANTPAYWQELRTRAAKYLPDRFKKTSQGGAQSAQEPDNSGQGSGSGAERPRRSTTVGGGGSGATGASGGGRQATVSALRVQAIKDAGRWDDPTERAKMIKAYQDYDKANPR